MQKLLLVNYILHAIVLESYLFISFTQKEHLRKKVV